MVIFIACFVEGKLSFLSEIVKEVHLDRDSRFLGGLILKFRGGFGWKWLGSGLILFS